MSLDRHARIAAATGAAVVAFLAAVVTTNATVAHFDLLIVAALHARATDPMRELALATTALGATPVVLLVTGIAATALIALRRWRGAVALIGSVALTQLTVAVVKLIVARPRPPAEDAIGQAGGFSFPSGHAATAVALYALLALLGAGVCRGAARVVVVVGGVAVALAVGASRVQLGVHFPTDVVAGWVTGAVLALASWLAVSRLPRNPVAAPAAPEGSDTSR